MNLRYYKHVVVIGVIAIMTIAVGAWLIDYYSVDSPEGALTQSFWIRSDPPISLPCSSNLAPYELDPRDSMLIVVQLSLMNESSNSVHITANESTIEAVTTGGQSIRPIDPTSVEPFVNARLSGELDAAYQSRLWGDIEVEPFDPIHGFVLFETSCSDDVAMLHFRSHGHHNIRYQ